MRTAALLLLSTCAITPIFGQALTCNPVSGVPPIIRVEGKTELISDVVLTCQAPSAGFQGTLNFLLNLNTVATSRVGEPLLMLNEPNTQGGLPLALNSNVFVGTVSGSQVQFNGVGISAGSNQTVTIRITNVRADASVLGLSSTLIPSTVIGFVSATPSNLAAINNPQMTLAFISRGLAAPSQVIDTTSSACISSNPQLANSNSATGAIVQRWIAFKEGFQTSFRARSGAYQGLPGAQYNTETGFYDPAAPVTAAALAASGTRLVAKFLNVPAGARVFVTTGPVPAAMIGATLTQSETGAFVPVAPTTTASDGPSLLPIAPVSIQNGSGQAVWEVNSAGDTTIDTFTFGFLVAFNAGQVNAGSIRVQSSIGPYSTTTAAPRFVEITDASATFTIASCAVTTPDLTAAELTGAATPAGGSMPVRFSIRNLNAAAAGAFDYRLELLVGGTLSVVESRTFRRASPLPTGADPISVLLPLGSNLTPGRYTLRLAVDTGAEVPESDESNNILTQDVFVTCSRPLPITQIVKGAEAGGTAVRLPAGCSVPPFTTSGTFLSATPTTVNFTQNVLPSTRTGQITFNYGGVLPVVQTGAEPRCTYAVSQFPSGTTATYSVASLSLNPSQSDCAWTTASDSGWLQVFPLSGVGSAQLQVAVFPNFTLSPRLGTVAVANQERVLLQAASTGSVNRRRVQLIYFNFFGRMPSEGEINLQQAELDRGVPLEELVERFYGTPEFNNGGRVVAGAYLGLLTRDAEYSGWLFQRNAVSAFNTTTRQLISNFLGSAEWKLRFGQPSDADFVRLLYRYILLREASQSEVNFHVGTLTSGQVANRVEMAFNFLSSNEFRTGTNARLTASLLYFTLLFRDPTSIEAQDAQNRILNGVPLRTVIKSLVDSAEFAAITE